MRTASRPHLDLAQLLLGRPIRTDEEVHERLGKPTALAVFASDNLSSSAYATEEILHVLVPVVGLGAFSLVVPLSLAMVGVLALLVISYRQTIKEYPTAGGAYIVTRDNFGLLPAQVAGTALLTDYVLTVSVSVAAGVAALTSAFERLIPYRVPVSVAFIAVLASRGEAAEGIVEALGGDELLDEAGIDDGASFDDVADGVEEVVHVGDPALEQVADPVAAGEEFHGVVHLHVGGEDQYAHVGELAADDEGGVETLGGAGGRHADVDDDQIGNLGPHHGEQLVTVAGLADHLVARAFQQAGHALPEQDIVVSQDHPPRAHGTIVVVGHQLRQPALAGSTSMRKFSRQSMTSGERSLGHPALDPGEQNEQRHPAAHGAEHTGFTHPVAWPPLPPRRSRSRRSCGLSPAGPAA